MFQLSTLHTSQLRLSPPRNLIINPLSRLWDKLLPDQIGINRRISGGGEVEEVEEEEVVEEIVEEIVGEMVEEMVELKEVDRLSASLSF